MIPYHIGDVFSFLFFSCCSCCKKVVCDGFLSLNEKGFGWSSSDNSINIINKKSIVDMK